MEDGVSVASGGVGDALDLSIKRACDQCRVRKIRCDKESPCSNCRTATRACSSTGAGQKQKESRQRVLISTQYERKIDHIEDRLGSIEALLRNLSTSSSPSHRAASTDPSHHDASAGRGPSPATGDASSTLRSSTTGGGGGDGDGDDDDLDSTVFEGTSSLAAHTVFASEFLSHHPLPADAPPHPDMSTALSSLQHMAHLHTTGARGAEHTLRFPHQKPLPPGGLRDLPMPPMGMVVDMLREIKDNPPSAFTLILCFIAVEDYTEQCKSVYFASEDFSTSAFIVVNNGLCYLFQERAVRQGDGFLAMESEGYAEMCRDNMETALANLDLFLPAKKENIEALLVGASWAVELAKPSLAWMLTSKALQLCHTLGYHRASTFTSPPANSPTSNDSRPILFWTAYMLDKGISLSLGRASTMQDYDITLPRSVGAIAPGAEWRAMLDAWITHAEIQGLLYEQLYSPRALSQPEGTRVGCARALAARGRGLLAQTQLAVASFREGKEGRKRGGEADRFDGDVLMMMAKSDEVAIFATLTLIYRAIPPPEGVGGSFHPECIETARETIGIHLFCMQMLAKNAFLAASYLNWTILFAPFIPFIILFCHIIETSNTEDLSRLADFVASLQNTLKPSAALEKLSRLCRVLHNVAALYVEAKRQPPAPGGGVPIGSEVDMYLSALGLLPSDMTIEGGIDPSTSPPPTAQASHLGDWFSGNRHMMELLEEDMMNWSAVP